MSTNPTITLYDLPTKSPNPTSWSLNPWKARAALNFKSLPYKTQWVEYPDLATTARQLGIPPNSKETNPNAEFSAPFAGFPDGSFVMDSRAIAEKLEKMQPEPSLRMDAKEVIDRTQAAVLGVWGALAPVGMPRIPGMVLPDRSAEYFRRTREKRFGMSLEEFEKSEKGGETAWKNVETHFEELERILKEDKGGVFVLGKEPGFADLIVGGLWTFMKHLDREGDFFGRAMGMSNVFPVHYRAVEKWFQRDD